MWSDEWWISEWLVTIGNLEYYLTGEEALVIIPFVDSTFDMLR